jgi:peptidoglycan/xylan/chitin deacetylase (PgdA/CDA1 family)
LLSDDQLREMQAAGWEIANHTRTHRDLATLTQAEVEDEIAGAKADLAARGFNVTLFVYPYGRSNAMVRAIAKKYHYATARVGGGMNGWRRRAGSDLGRYNFGTQYAQRGQNTLRFYEAKVDSAGRNGLWLIYMVHQLVGADAYNLGNLLDYIHARGIPIVTVTAGLELLRSCQVRP